MKPVFWVLVAFPPISIVESYASIGRAPSGIGRGEPTVIIPLVAYGPKVQMVILCGLVEAEALVVR